MLKSKKRSMFAPKTWMSQTSDPFYYLFFVRLGEVQCFHKVPETLLNFGVGAVGRRVPTQPPKPSLSVSNGMGLHGNVHYNY